MSGHNRRKPTDYPMPAYCVTCGQRFLAIRKSHVFCSAHCRNRDRSKRRYPTPLTVACAVCGQRFKKKNYNQKYCTVTCARKAQYKRERADIEDVAIPRNCAWCNMSFIAHRKDGRFCSRKCRDAYNYKKGRRKLGAINAMLAEAE